MSIPSMYKHQQATADFSANQTLVMDTSDPGTGKTRATLEGWMRRRKEGRANRLLVVAPLSILEPSWGGDIREFTTGVSFAVATAPAKNRRKAFATNADIILINTDGVVWLRENLDVLNGFTDLCVDEFSSFKNRTATRSRACYQVSKRFAHKTILSGTPIQNSLTDLWHPVFMLDGGKRLGASFSKYRLQVTTPVQRGPRPEHIKWEDKPGAAGVVAAALSDITIRHVFEECVDIPEHATHTLEVELPPQVRKAYREMEQQSVIEAQESVVTAVNAAVRANKLLQIISGAVYDREGNAVFIDNTRAELAISLAADRDHSIIGFTWQHEKEGLLREARRRKMTVEVIDGTVPVKRRTQIVKDYQEGKYQVLLCHPQSAGHGLTLTRGRATIWCSATNSSEHFKQLNRRIYRAGQTKKTETIMICARNTREDQVYEMLGGKIFRMDDLLDLFTGMYKEERKCQTK